MLVNSYSDLDVLLNIKGMLVVPCCRYKVKSLLIRYDVTPPSWLSIQGLRFLSPREVQDIFQNGDESIDFINWLLKKRHLSDLWESIVLTDCIHYLRSKGWTNAKLKGVSPYINRFVITTCSCTKISHKHYIIKLRQRKEDKKNNTQLLYTENIE